MRLPAALSPARGRWNCWHDPNSDARICAARLGAIERRNPRRDDHRTGDPHPWVEQSLVAIR